MSTLDKCEHDDSPNYRSRCLYCEYHHNKIRVLKSKCSQCKEKRDHLYCIHGTRRAKCIKCEYLYCKFHPHKRKVLIDKCVDCHQQRLNVEMCHNFAVYFSENSL